MAQAKARFCRAPAFARFVAHLPELDAPQGLLGAAVALSMHELPQVSLAEVAGRLSGLGQSVSARVRSGQESAVVAHLHDLLFDELGLTGDVGDFDNPANSYLSCVLQTRLGLPITLCLIYYLVGRQVGLNVRGINAPGHFLAAVQFANGDGVMYVDPFHDGRMLTRQEAVEVVSRALGSPLPEDANVLEPASHRQWVNRMLLNLQRTFAAVGRCEDQAAMAELRAVLWV